MAKPKKAPPPKDTSKALAEIETPRVKWNIVAQIAGIVLVVWVLAVLMIPYVGYWGVAIVGVLTAVLIGFGLYAWNFTRKQARVVEILKKATDAEGRRAAIAELEQAGDSKDATNALARFQLVAQESPREAMRILEEIDLSKAQGAVQDEVRANLAWMYMLQGRAKDARPLVDQLRLDRTPVAKAKAMYAAVSAECYSRTGKPEEAKKLLDTYKAEDPEYAEVAVMLRRAQIYTYFATKNRGLARRAMIALAEVDANMLAPFLQNKAVSKDAADMREMAREVLSEVGFATKQKMKVQR